MTYKFKRFIASVLALILIVNIISFSAVTLSFAKKKKVNEVTEEYLQTEAKAPSTYSDSVVLMDAKTGEVLYSKNGKKKVHPASTTKVMTALVALENNDLQDTITYTADEVLGLEENSSSVALDIGETITVEQSLYAAMLESANECCNGLADKTAGSIKGFADMMNKRAEELGCVKTHFVNANGLYNKDHYTCAYDLALITRAAMAIDEFKKITGTKVYEVPPTNKQKETRYWRNHHNFINNDLPYDSEIFTVLGGKTGYTVQSSYSLVTFAKSNTTDLELICVTMHCDAYGHYNGKGFNRTFTDANAMFKYGFNNFTSISANINTESDLEEDDLNAVTKTYSLLQDKRFISFSATDDCEVVVSNDFDVNQLKGTFLYDSEGAGDTQGKWGSYEFRSGSNVIASTDVFYELNEPVIKKLYHKRVEPNKQEKVNHLLIVIGAAVVICAALYVIIMLCVKYKLLSILVKGKDIFDISKKTSVTFKPKRKRMKKMKAPDLGYLTPKKKRFHRKNNKNKLRF